MTKHIFVCFFLFFSSIILPFIAHADHPVGDRDTDHINLRESDVVLIRLLSKDKHNHIYSLILDNTKGKKNSIKTRFRTESDVQPSLSETCSHDKNAWMQTKTQHTGSRGPGSVQTSVAARLREIGRTATDCGAIQGFHLRHDVRFFPHRACDRRPCSSLVKCTLHVLSNNAEAGHYITRPKEYSNHRYQTQKKTRSTR